MRIMTSFIAAVLVVLGLTVPAFAQQVEIEVPAPERPREPLVVPPGDQYETGRPPDADIYPGPGPKVRVDPGFVGPLSRRYATPNQTGRFGFAGWTSPNTPVNPWESGTREVNGWFSLGFAVEWGGPPPTLPAAQPR